MAVAIVTAFFLRQVSKYFVGYLKIARIIRNNQEGGS